MTYLDTEVVTVEIEAKELHYTDTIVSPGGVPWRVVSVSRSAYGKVKVVTVNDNDVEYGGTLAGNRVLTVVNKTRCDKCGGTGEYKGGGVVENGVYKGFSGPCFGCEAKGYQTRKDVIRNAVYHNKYARIPS